MVSVQEIHLVSLIKKAQRKKNDPVIVDLFCNTISTYGGTNSEKREVHYTYKWDGAIEGMLEHLERIEVLKKIDEDDRDGVYQLNYDGRYLLLRLLIKFIVTCIGIATLFLSI